MRILKRALIFVALLAVFQTYIDFCGSQHFNHRNFGVIFNPLIKQNKTAGNVSTYETYEDVETMLGMVSTRFSTIFTTMVGAYRSEYEYNQTYHNGSFASVYSSEIAAKINKDNKAASVTVYLGLRTLESIYRTEMLLALECAEKANEIFPGTVKGITFHIGFEGYRVGTVLEYVQEYRMNATQLGLNLGLEGYCRDFMNPSNQTQYDMERELVLLTDYFICHFNPGDSMIQMGPDACFNQIKDYFWQDSAKIRKVKPDYDLMVLTRWENSDVENWEKAKNQSLYWQAASTYGLANNVTIVLKQAFDNAGTVPDERQTGWWNLTDDSRMNELDAYIEKMPVIALPENPTDESSSSPVVIIVSVIAASIILCLLLISLVIIIRNRKHQRLYGSQIEYFFKGTPMEPEYRDGSYATISAALIIPYDTSYEFSKNMLRIDNDHLLGEGNFGYVFKATINYDDKDADVAVKMTRRSAPKNALNGILSEIKILTYLGKHANIVTLKGAYTSELAKGVVYLATELCSLGSLEGHLMGSSFSTEAEGISGNTENLDKSKCVSGNITNAITIQDMSKWAYDIACGMEYLGSKQVVHADLATRNVLLTSNKAAKISDFGLSRRMYDYQMYIKKGEEPLPWRWMAIESLKKCEFSAQSDVWSYGVTLWEIFSMGDTPYPGISWTVDFADKLSRGLRLQRPKYATEQMYSKVETVIAYVNLHQGYSIMSMCWHVDPLERISFTSLRDHIDSTMLVLHGSSENEGYVTRTYIPDNAIYLDKKDRVPDRKLLHLV